MGWYRVLRCSERAGAEKSCSARDHSEHDDSSKGRSYQWEENAPKETNGPAAVNGGSFFQFVRHLAKEPAQNQNIEGKRECNLGQNNAPQGIHQPRLAQRDIERQDCDRDGKEQAEGHEIKGKFAPSKVDPRKTKAAMLARTTTPIAVPSVTSVPVEQHPPKGSALQDVHVSFRQPVLRQTER